MNESRQGQDQNVEDSIPQGQRADAPGDQEGEDRRPKTFLSEYVKWDKALIKDEATAALIYDSFCRFMQSWMLNENQPVDLGFAKLYALMARINFPAAVYHRCNGQHTQNVICENLTHDYMAAWDVQRASFRWNLFVVPSESFRSTYRAFEEAKKERVHGEGTQRSKTWYYCRKANDQLRRQLANAYEIYRTFISEAQHPVLVLPRSGQKRRNWDALGPVRKKVRPAPSLDRQSVVVGASLDAGTAQVVATADEGVLSMSDFQQREENVRDGPQNVDEHEGGNGSARMLVLAPAEKQNKD